MDAERDPGRARGARRQRRGLQLTHEKNSAEGNAGGAATAALDVAYRTPPPTMHHEAPHDLPGAEGAAAPALHDKTSAKVEALAENTYASEARPGTTSALFADPGQFDPDAIRRRPHYLARSLGGTLWLDADGDGRRGSASNASLDATERGTGLGGVHVFLAHCASDALTGTNATSRPESGPGEYLEAGAGRYAFPLDGKRVKEGRYYAVYAAPRGYRLGGPVLPLATGGHFDCVPRGGEGGGYRAEVRRSGDLDWDGYCARSVGCFDVGPRAALTRRYADLSPLPGAEGTEGAGAEDFFAALPAPAALDVGLAPEAWPLSTYQYADATVTLAFAGAQVADLEREAAPRGFGGSAARRGLEAALAQALTEDSEGTVFTIQGLEVRGAEVLASEESEEVPRRRRRLQREEGAAADRGAGVGPAARVRYTLTTRGAYRPPPAAQIGELLEDSLNRDPVRLAQALRDRAHDGPAGLPPLFRDVASAEFRHVTARAPTLLSRSDRTGPLLAGWAIAPAGALTGLIVVLAGALVARRMGRAN